MADRGTVRTKVFGRPFISRPGKEGREVACALEQAAVIHVLMVAALVLIMKVGAAQASMYVCRDKSGAMQFTNAPSSSSCHEHQLKETSRVRIPLSATAGGDPSDFDQDIGRIARRYQLDPPLIKAIIRTESDFNPRAVSRRGAQGLMQLMPETARDLDVSDPFDPRENIDGGSRYLRYLLDNFDGDLILSLAAYNAGPGRVGRTGGVPRIQETREYIYKVLTRYKAYKIEKSHLLASE